MLHTIPLAADTPRVTVRAALERTSARDVALVFPLGQHCTLADADEMARLFQDCETLDKTAVIIGGDAALRASAVAAGFAAATALDEWETGHHRAMSRVGDARADADLPSDRPTSGYLYVLLPEPDDTEPGLYDAAGDDPPPYVAELLPRDDTPPAERYAAIPTLPRVPTPAQDRRDEARHEAAQTAALERAQHAYEERVTGTIRATGVDGAVEHGGDTGDAPSSDDGDRSDAALASEPGESEAEAEGS